MDAVYAIESRSFAIPWSKESIRDDFLKNKHALYFVATACGAAAGLSVPTAGMPTAGMPTAEDTVVGYASLWHIVNEGHINNIAVDEPFRRMGVGARLMDALIATAEAKGMVGLTLEVRMGNRAAMALYHKYGFKAEGIRKNYYTDTKEDAVIMWRYRSCRHE